MKFGSYTVTQIDEATWHIADQVNAYMYLLAGRERACVIDTGIGVRALRPLLETLTDKPISVLNTHGHLDHTGCNFEFDRVYIANADIDQAEAEGDPMSCRKRMDQAMDYARWILGENAPDERPEASELGIDVPTSVIGIEDGFTLELGGRRLEAFAIPSHTAGCMCFFDPSRKYLFTGDVICDSYGIIMGESGIPVERFYNRLRVLWERRDEYEAVFPAHHHWPLKKRIVGDFLLCARDILDGKASGADDAVHGDAVIHYSRDAVWERA